MFGDYSWESSRTDKQNKKLNDWFAQLKQAGAKLAIVEMGAGTAVPTVRHTSEQVAQSFSTPLIRINPRESFGAEIALPMGAVEALEHIL